MNYSKFSIVIVCLGYAKQLEACLWHWRNCSYPNFQIVVATSRKDTPTLEVVQQFQKDLKLTYVLVEEHRKGQAISQAVNFLKDPEWIVLSDADVLFPENALNCLNLSVIENPRGVFSAKREDLVDIDLFYQEYQKSTPDWAWRSLKRKILSPSPFMGWFLTFPADLPVDYQVKHQGYDSVDWKIYGQLKSLGLKEELIYFENPPLHLYHGEKGKNWKGVEL